MKTFLFLLFFFTSGIALAQNCTASAGAPVIKITFGAGAGFGPPLAPGITNMEYIQDQCPVDGQYSITNKTISCWSAPHGWQNITRDHTGDSNGYFMLINASLHPSNFYVQTISELCSGMNYELGVWILCPDTARIGKPANITLSIEAPDGTIIKQASTGDIPKMRSEKWLQYKVSFTLPANMSSVVLRMRNNGTGGYGNDLAIDDITLRAIGQDLAGGTIYFPTAFTPNGDGKNDLFKGLPTGSLSDYHLFIYNRWGQKLFETKEYTYAWNGSFNGKQQPNDTYIWWCTFKKPGGEKNIHLKGTVLLIR